MSQDQPDTLLEIDDLHKTFRVGFFARKVDALRGVSFRVKRGETFGLLGPNGAGKTTTLKTVLGLVRPTRGTVKLFGLDPSVREARTRLGYLPENPYVYQYLRPLEFLDLCGAIVGLSKADRTRRAEEMIDRVGLRHAVDRPIGKFSKGMTQRIGLAQCLLHDPELIVLDEPMSGLDPIGRKEVRDLLVAERARGKTIVITTHILSDVEQLCDHVAIVQRGKVVEAGSIDTLLSAKSKEVEIDLLGDAPGFREKITASAKSIAEHGARLVVIAHSDEAAQVVIREASLAGIAIRSVTPHKETLEELFVRNAHTGENE